MTIPLKALAFIFHFCSIFFENYVNFGSGDFYKKYVNILVEDEEVMHHARVHELSGFTGAINSTDKMD